MMHSKFLRNEGVKFDFLTVIKLPGFWGEHIHLMANYFLSSPLGSSWTLTLLILIITWACHGASTPWIQHQGVLMGWNVSAPSSCTNHPKFTEINLSLCLSHTSQEHSDGGEDSCNHKPRSSTEPLIACHSHHTQSHFLSQQSITWHLAHSQSALVLTHSSWAIYSGLIKHCLPSILFKGLSLGVILSLLTHMRNHNALQHPPSASDPVTNSSQLQCIFILNKKKQGLHENQIIYSLADVNSSNESYLLFLFFYNILRFFYINFKFCLEKLTILLS